MKKKIILVDIDGTIADISHRVHLVRGEGKKNWKGFFDACEDDEDIPEVINTVLALSEYFQLDIVLCTGRPEWLREKTMDWLDANTPIPIDTELLMRGPKDFRPDYITKKALVEDAGYTLEDIYAVFEDRNTVVKMWRDNGVKCFQVQDGDF